MADNLVDEFGWANSVQPESCNYIAPCILQVIKKLNVKRILDLGAGNGALCSLLSSSGFDSVGVDCDEGGLEIAKRAHPSIRFYRYGLQDDPADLLRFEGQFDTVVSTEVVEHLYSPHHLPIFAKSMLTPGGYLLVSTPYHGYLKNLALAIANAWDKHHTPLWHGGHIKFWSKKTLSRLLTEGGFNVVGFFGVGRLPFLWKSMILIAKKN